jgi:hypothetical protein
MKNLTKLLLIILVLNSHQNTNAEILGIGDNYNFCQFYGPITSLEAIIRFKYKLQKAPDAPDIIKQFCYKKLKAQGLKTDHVQIKIVDGQWLAAFSDNYIILGPSAAEELKKALEDPDNEKSTKALKIYSFFLDHELAHLKHKDAPTKRLTAYSAASLVSLGLSVYIMNASHFSYLYHVDTKTGSEYTKISPQTTYQRFLLGLGAQIFTLFIYSRYAQFQERRADAYAISLTKDPEVLYYAANFLERSEDHLMYHLSEAKIDMYDPFKSIFMIGLRRIFLTLYQTQKTNEDFHSWIKRQPLSYSLVRLFWDMEHPSGYSRAHAIRLAAETMNLSPANTGSVAISA